MWSTMELCRSAVRTSAAFDFAAIWISILSQFGGASSFILAVMERSLDSWTRACTLWCEWMHLIIIWLLQWLNDTSQVHLLHARCHRPSNAKVPLVEEVPHCYADCAVHFSFRALSSAVLLQSLRISVNLLLCIDGSCSDVLLPVPRFVAFHSTLETDSNKIHRQHSTRKHTPPRRTMTSK
jgi:hypothetical protein